MARISNRPGRGPQRELKVALIGADHVWGLEEIVALLDTRVKLAA